MKNLKFSIITMFIIFSPNIKFLPKFSWVLSLFGILTFFDNKFRKKFFLLRKSFLLVIYIVIMSFITCIGITAIKGTNDYTFYPIFVGLLLSIFRSVLIVYIYNKIYAEANINKYIDLFVNSCCCYVMSTFILIVFPSFKKFWFGKIINPIEVANPEFYPYRLGFDGFAGFATATIFSIATFFAAYNLIMSEKRNYNKNLVKYIFIIVGDLIYGRITYVAIGLSIIYMVSNSNTIRKKIIFINKIFIIAICVIGSLWYFSRTNIELKRWFEWAFEIFVNYFKYGEFTSYSSSHLLQDMIFIPDIKTLFWGDGLYMVMGKYYMSTDVGYIRGILYGGIFWLIFNYSALLIIFNRIIKYFNKLECKYASNMFKFLLLNFFIFEIKGESYHLFAYSLVPVYIVLKNDLRRRGNNEKSICNIAGI